MKFHNLLTLLLLLLHMVPVHGFALQFILDFLAYIFCDVLNLCDDDDDPCDPNPCQNGGTCDEVGDDGYECTCPAGFGGNQCETVSTNPCSSNPCQNGGTCLFNGTAWSCSCPSGFSGSVCQNPDAGDNALNITEFVYRGAFRLPNLPDPGLGWSAGVLAYSPRRDSFYIVGHDQYQTVSEFASPSIPLPPPDTDTAVDELPVADSPLQFNIPILDLAGGQAGELGELNMITGMLLTDDDSLLVNCEYWYASHGGTNNETTFVVTDATDLAGSVVPGFFSMEGAAESAGYMGRIPDSLQFDFGGAKFYTGWSTVHSCVSGCSLGPSLWTFDPAEALLPNTPPGSIDATAHMNYGYCNYWEDCTDRYLSPGANDIDWDNFNTTCANNPADRLWNPLSRAVYAFFEPNTRTFVAIGSTAGIETGMNYKCYREDGVFVNGPSQYGVDDVYNYYWFFGIDDILAAPNVYNPVPYAYGVWDVPYDANGHNRIIGGAFDAEDGVLYVALEHAGQEGEGQPLIVTFDLPS